MLDSYDNFSSVSQSMFGHTSLFYSFELYLIILMSPAALYEGSKTPISSMNYFC